VGAGTARQMQHVQEVVLDAGIVLTECRAWCRDRPDSCVAHAQLEKEFMESVGGDGASVTY